MAFGVRIEAYSPPGNTPWLMIEPKYWEAEELKRDPRFQFEPEMEGYDDYVAKLNTKQFAELQERFKSRIAGSLWDGESWRETIQAKVAMLDAAIVLSTQDWDYFVVTVFEWSSGY